MPIWRSVQTNYLVLFVCKSRNWNVTFKESKCQIWRLCLLTNDNLMISLKNTCVSFYKTNEMSLMKPPNVRFDVFVSYCTYCQLCSITCHKNNYVCKNIKLGNVNIPSLTFCLPAVNFDIYNFETWKRKMIDKRRENYDLEHFLSFSIFVSILSWNDTFETIKCHIWRFCQFWHLFLLPTLKHNVTKTAKSVKLGKFSIID